MYDRNQLARLNDKNSDDEKFSQMKLVEKTLSKINLEKIKEIY